MAVQNRGPYSPARPALMFRLCEEQNISHLTKLVDYITFTSCAFNFSNTVVDTESFLKAIFYMVPLDLGCCSALILLSCSIVHNYDYALKRRPVQIYVFLWNRKQWL